MAACRCQDLLDYGRRSTIRNRTLAQHKQVPRALPLQPPPPPHPSSRESKSKNEGAEQEINEKLDEKVQKPEKGGKVTGRKIKQKNQSPVVLRNLHP